MLSNDQFVFYHGNRTGLPGLNPEIELDDVLPGELGLPESSFKLSLGDDSDLATDCLQH